MKQFVPHLKENADYRSNLYLFCDAVMKSLKHLVIETGDAAQHKDF